MFHRLHWSGAQAVERIVGTINVVVLLVMWKVNKLFENWYYNYGKRTKRKSSSSPSSYSSHNKNLRRKSTKNEEKLLFNPLSKVPSYLTISDLISPMEEEMLRCICAKGYNTTKSDEIQGEASPSTATEKQIPRATFTAIWIESCAR